ncbi:MAG: DMT family transporter [bacterium]|nr:DMT family transporter [bacterium]
MVSNLGRYGSDPLGQRVGPRGDGSIYRGRDESPPVIDKHLPPPESRLLYYAVLGGIVLIVGFNWPILDRGVDLIPPFWLVAFRLLGGALVGLGMNAAAGQRASFPRRDWRIVPILGCSLAAVAGLTFYALQILPPGRSSILIWTSTLWSVPLAVAFLGERMSRMQVGGLVIGMVGVGLVFEPWELSLSEPRVIWGYVMLLGASLFIAGASVYIRGHSWGANPLASTPWQMLAGAVPVLALALAVDGAPGVQWTWESGGIVAYQITLGGPLALWGRLTAFRHIPAISVNLTLMATPVVGLLASWWLVDEVLTLTVVGGLALIIAGAAANILGDKDVRPLRFGLA